MTGSPRNSWCGCRRCCNQAILALFDARNTEERTELLVRLVMLELHQAEDSATFVPLPHEPRCRRAAMIVLDDPTGLHDIDTLAREVGTSARTLSRLFSTETQLSFKSWCQRARIAAAIQRISTDASVSVKQLADPARLCQRAGVFGRVPSGDGADADGVCGEGVSTRLPARHCERSEAIQYLAEAVWIAPLALAMTACAAAPRSPHATRWHGQHRT